MGRKKMANDNRLHVRQVAVDGRGRGVAVEIFE
jgi:hypothetical protein